MKLSSQQTVLTLANTVALASGIVQHARGTGAAGVSHEKLEAAVAARVYARVSRVVAAAAATPAAH